jgi:hypothetical protein
MSQPYDISKEFYPYNHDLAPLFDRVPIRLLTKDRTLLVIGTRRYARISTRDQKLDTSTTCCSRVGVKKFGDTVSGVSEYRQGGTTRWRMSAQVIPSSSQNSADPFTHAPSAVGQDDRHRPVHVEDHHRKKHGRSLAVRNAGSGAEFRIEV